MSHALALDIGGSHITAAIVDLDKRQVIETSQVRRDVAHDSPADVLFDTWATVSLEALLRAGLSGVTRIGAAMPGPFDYPAGISWHTQKFTALYGLNVIEALQMRWKNTPLSGTPLQIANDAGLWALGEWWLGSVQGNERIIGITLGTGLGSGFISDGKIVTEGDEVPPKGEIWWVPYQNGICEDYVAGPALVRAYQKRSGQEIAVDKISALAMAGDSDAQEVFHEFGAHFAAVLSPWVTRFQPDSLVVGGNIARAWALFHAPLEAGLPSLSCRPTQLYETSGLLGAAVLGG
jgi:glucokinase